jgi:hypothetical protein
LASAHQPGRAFVTKAGWHRDDYRPFVFRTEDFGETWTAAAGNLPEGTVYVVAEDRKNPDLLFVGTEMSVFATLDGGRSWARFGRGLPANALVHDLLVHPRENDLVVATHGRGLFVTDITPLQEMTGAFWGSDVRLFAVEPKIPWPVRRAKLEGIDGDRTFKGPNEPAGLVINYFLRTEAKDKVVLRVTDPFGEEIAVLEGPETAGLHSVVWDMRRAPARAAGGRGQAQAQPRARFAPLVPPGEYVVILETGGKKFTQRTLVRPVPE